MSAAAETLLGGAHALPYTARREVVTGAHAFGYFPRHLAEESEPPATKTIAELNTILQADHLAPLLIHRLPDGNLITAVCGAQAGEHTDKWRHTAWLSLLEADRARHAVCLTCWPEPATLTALKAVSS